MHAVGVHAAGGHVVGIGAVVCHAVGVLVVGRCDTGVKCCRCLAYIPWLYVL